MRIHLYSPAALEPWDWRNSTEGGIGGSETCHTELAWRLAARGHEVYSYSPKPSGEAEEWQGVHWKPLVDADFSAPGLWIVFRDAECLDRFKGEDQTIWLLLQDTVTHGDFTAERGAKCDRVIALCKEHEKNCAKLYPFVADKLFLSSNGIKREVIEEVEGLAIDRNPKRLMYASGPERGLLTLLEIFRRCRERIPDLELHCFYGLQNLELAMKVDPRFLFYRKLIVDLEKAMDQPGVFWHGRVSQAELYCHWFASGIWCHPTHFRETSCITCMEAQACGAIPITRPLWALADNVRHGIWIEGDPQTDMLVRARYVDAIYDLIVSQERMRLTRIKMMPWARKRFSWECIVNQFDHWARRLELVAC